MKMKPGPAAGKRRSDARLSAERLTCSVKPYVLLTRLSYHVILRRLATCLLEKGNPTGIWNRAPKKQVLFPVSGTILA